ncbi:MAG: hypothetical protein MRERC_16c003 [Mycoplasmataceae bacterium RC_NB112A]|nr:MAG: hypothetical protein MRERC_16c003 [Mycoplasmataceae bacterium RC_NB112A]
MEELKNKCVKQNKKTEVSELEKQLENLEFQDLEKKLESKIEIPPKK